MASSRYTSQTNKVQLQCTCGVEAILNTSGTSANPGKKFYGCPNWKELEKQVKDLQTKLGNLELDHADLELAKDELKAKCHMMKTHLKDLKDDNILITHKWKVAERDLKVLKSDKWELKKASKAANQKIMVLEVLLGVVFFMAFIKFLI